MNEVVYLESLFSRDGRYEMDAERRIAVGNRVKGALAVEIVSTAARCNAGLAATLLYGSKTWLLQKKNEIKINTVEIGSLRTICGFSLSDRPIRERYTEWQILARIQR